MHDIKLQEFFRRFMGSIEKVMQAEFLSHEIYKFGCTLRKVHLSLRCMNNRLMLFKEPVVYCKLYERLMRCMVRMQLSYRSRWYM
jgi:hypothetical protein